jgi:hypothetical protein
MGEGNKNLVYPSPWDLKRSFTCIKILQHGMSGFTSHPKENVLRIFIALKKSIALTGFEPGQGGTRLFPGFEPAIPATKRPQTYASDRAATPAAL